MESIEKKYPRIYSISTVGIRNHNNTDFLIHPLRTDFTGQSGTGKSLIGADLPQLILTAGKFYKSATKPKGDVSRDYNSIILSNKDFGYVFMNIECKPGEFIVIGVMIRRSPKQLHPFIIQSNIGIHPENNPKFKSLDKIIRYKDFLVNNEILSLENIKKYLDSQNIYMTSFYHNTQAYHKLLFENKILHLDLSSDDELQRQYAHTLQSLARGEDIDTSGNKFKKFLFHYDDEIIEKFRNQSKSIEDDHRKYEANWKAQNTLSKKKDSLLNLVLLKKIKTEAYELRLNKETSYNFQLMKMKETELKKATVQLFQTELEIISIKERKIQLEIDHLEKDNKVKTDELKKNQTTFDNAKEQLDSIDIDLGNILNVLPILEYERDELKTKNDKYKQVDNWLKVYNSIGAISEKFETQKEITEQRKKLNTLFDFLNSNKLIEIFELSEYSKSIKSAIEFYKKERESLDYEIGNIRKLKEIILNQNKSSLAGWAVNEEIKLNELQESVLFHFATTPTKYTLTNNYIPEPDQFIKGLTTEVQKTDFGFIINLSGLHYHIPKRENYIFTNPKKIKDEIEKIGNDFQSSMILLQDEIDKINNLEKLFTGFNYSQEYLNAYLNKDKITSFISDPTLDIMPQHFAEIIEIYNLDIELEKIEKVSSLYFVKQKEYEEKLGQKSTNEQNKNTQTDIKQKAKNQIDLLKDDIDKKNKRIYLLQNTELVGIEKQINDWKTKQTNSIQEKQEDLLKQYKLKYKSQKEEAELTETLIDLSRKSGTLEGDIKGINLILPTLTNNYSNKKKEFEIYFKHNFNQEELFEEITNESLEIVKEKASSSKSAYENKYIETLEIFRDDLQDNPKINNHQYDLNTLILELIPIEIIRNKENPDESLQIDIEDKLTKLHLQIKELNKEEAKKIYNTLRDLKNIVEKQINFLELVKALLKDFHLASYHKVLLNWSYSSDYNLKWIDALNNDIENLNFTDNLFGDKTKISAQELLELTFKRYCPSMIDAKANEILNPFNYYEASAIIADPNNNPSPGSSGQNYGMLALLCIAKLSIVEGKTRNIFDKIEPGIRILPIDEVAGLGENFDMLYDIAQRLDYQIFTMTITANDLTFENGKQIYYEFIKNSDEKLFEYNEGIQACFSKENLIDDIETHFANSIFNLKLQINDSN